MLILVREIQRITDFQEDNKMECCEIVAELDLINCEELVNQAKILDKENYSEKCFGIDFNYVYDDNMLYILNVPNCIYYVDNYGEKNYLEVSDIIINNIERSIFNEVKKFIKDKEKYIQEQHIEYQVI